MIPVVLGLGSNRALKKAGIAAGSPSDSAVSEKSTGALQEIQTVLTPCDVLRLACDSLSHVLTGLKASSVYVTKPMYVTDQPDFYNMAVFGYYDGSSESLLEKTQAIEAEYGRDRSREIRNGPRSLDIDIELFGNEQIKTEKLFVPHPRIYERAFVLVPLLEILPVSADIPNRESFEKALTSIGTQGVQEYGRIFP